MDKINSEHQQLQWKNIFYTTGIVFFALLLSFYGKNFQYRETRTTFLSFASRNDDLCSKSNNFIAQPTLLRVDSSESIRNVETSIQVSKKLFQADSATDNVAEALAAMHLAKEMLRQGKKEKSLKLYQHAVSLSPSHSDILNEYGEFLEETEKDIVTAEHMYCRALIVNPEHVKALENRQRTLPVVDEIDRNLFRRIESKRDLLIQIPDQSPALRRMKRESYFKHIHHMTAIEGNTFTLSQTRSLIETRMAIAGKSVMEHNEILGMDSALSYLNTTLLHRIGEITKQDILDLHLRVLGFVDPISAGRIRTTQVYVGNFVPPPASEVDNLINEFIEWLNSDTADQLHPIQLAALAHYTLVAIHPFYDGNGRTSRLLMNLILMQAGYPPVTILKEDKHLYYQHLETANDGDVRPFIRFIAKCTEDTLDEYLWFTSDNPSLLKPSFDHISQRTIVIGSDE